MCKIANIFIRKIKWLNVIWTHEPALPRMPLSFLPCAFFPSADRRLFILLLYHSHLSLTWVQCWHLSLGRCWHPKGGRVFLTSSSPPSSSFLFPLHYPSASSCRRLCTSDTRVSSKGETVKVMPDNIKLLAVAMATWHKRNLWNSLTPHREDGRGDVCCVGPVGKHCEVSWSATCSYRDSRKSHSFDWMLSFPWFGLWSLQSCQYEIHLFDLCQKKKNLCSLNGLWATQSAGQGSRKEPLMSDQPRHIATVKLLTPFSIFWSSSCEGLYLPISCRDVTAADWGLWSCHPRWCFVTRLSTASPSCFIFHASRQTRPSLHPRTVVKLELKQLSFFFFFWTSDYAVPEYEATVWQNQRFTAPDTLCTLWKKINTCVFVLKQQQKQKYDTTLSFTDRNSGRACLMAAENRQEPSMFSATISKYLSNILPGSTRWQYWSKNCSWPTVSTPGYWGMTVYV